MLEIREASHDARAGSFAEIGVGKSGAALRTHQRGAFFAYLRHPFTRESAKAVAQRLARGTICSACRGQHVRPRSGTPICDLPSQMSTAS